MFVHLAFIWAAFPFIWRSSRGPGRRRIVAAFARHCGLSVIRLASARLRLIPSGGQAAGTGEPALSGSRPERSRGRPATPGRSVNPVAPLRFLI
jgi:hypothetical protein